MMRSHLNRGAERTEPSGAPRDQVIAWMIARLSTTRVARKPKNVLSPKDPSIQIIPTMENQMENEMETLGPF